MGTGTISRRAFGLGVASGLASATARAQDGGAPVKIGVLTDMSGAYSDLAGRGSVIAAEMAAEDFGGTVLGRPVRILSADHQGRPDIALNKAREWFDLEGVQAVGDLNNTSAALGVQALAINKKRVTLISSPSSIAFTNEQCSPYGVHWTYDTYSIGKSLALALAKPDASWFFITVDNAGGIALQNGLTPFILKAGGKVLGSVRHPLNSGDLSSFLLQAQSSGANYIVLANGGSDTTNAIKQAREFNIVSAGQTLVGTAVYTTDIKALGLEAANELVYATAFVSDSTPEAAAWSQRFLRRHNAMPNDIQAGLYSAVLHYLKAIQAAGSDDAAAVIAKMRDIPVNDMFARGGTVRKDGRMVHDMYLVQAKKPSESTGPWDLTRTLRTIPGEEAFRPLSETTCPYAK